MKHTQESMIGLGFDQRPREFLAGSKGSCYFRLLHMCMYFDELVYFYNKYYYKESMWNLRNQSSDTFHMTRQATSIAGIRPAGSFSSQPTWLA